MTTRKYTLKPDKPDERDFRYKVGKVSAPILPRKVDLRPKMSPVVDQGHLGSCTANAIASGLREYLLNRDGQYNPLLSRLYLYWHEREMEGTIDEDAGAYLRDGMKVLQKLGVCPEADFPYDVTRFREKPSDVAEAHAGVYRIDSYYRIMGDMLNMKEALAEGNPVVIGVAIYSSFESWNVSFDGLVPLPDKTKESFRGGHAMLVVGYDDDQQRVIVRNSWGTDWGDHGYCYLPYAYMDDPALTFDKWVGELAVKNPWDSVSEKDAIDYITSMTYKNGAPVSDSPQFWYNWLAKFDSSDPNFQYYGLLLRKIVAKFKE